MVYKETLKKLFDNLLNLIKIQFLSCLPLRNRKAILGKFIEELYTKKKLEKYECIRLCKP